MRIDETHLSELLDNVTSEGNPRLLVAPVAISEIRVVPMIWQELLTSPNADRLITRTLWAPVAQLLPKTVASIENKLRGLAILSTEKKRPSLIYLFTKEGDFFARRGYPPVTQLPEISRKLSVDISPLYDIHDGWVDFFSGDGGTMPINEWQVLGESAPGRRDGFLEVYSTGGSSLGFDLSESPASPYAIWSEGDVEPLESWWNKLDQRLANNLEPFDDRLTADADEPESR